MTMIRSLLQGKVMQAIMIAVVVMALWKATGGDVGKMVDGFLAFLDKASDMLLQAWNHIVH